MDNIQQKKHKSFEAIVEDATKLLMSYSGSLVIMTKEHYNRVKPKKREISHGGKSMKFKAYCVAMHIAGKKRIEINNELMTLGYDYKDMDKNINRAYKLCSQDDADRYVDLFLSFGSIFIRYGVYRADVINFLAAKGFVFNPSIKAGDTVKVSTKVFNDSDEELVIDSDAISHTNEVYFYDSPDVVIMSKSEYDSLQKELFDLEQKNIMFEGVTNSAVRQYGYALQELRDKVGLESKIELLKEQLACEQEKNNKLIYSIGELYGRLGTVKKANYLEGYVDGAWHIGHRNLNDNCIKLRNDTADYSVLLEDTLKSLTDLISSSSETKEQEF